MPLVVPDPALARLIHALPLEEALLRCAHRISTGQARDALKRWFGDASPLFAVRVRSVLIALARTVRTREVRLVLGTGRPGPRDVVDWRPVALASDIAALEPYLAMQDGGVLAEKGERSRFSELAQALASQLCGAEAEGWGAFIEAVGVHRAR